jgi:N-acetylglutamate synthase-like GNAT family acetyltransferase
MPKATKDENESSVQYAYQHGTATDSHDFEKLQFVRLKIPRLIPGDLIEAVKGRTFTTEQFYKYQELQIDNPYNHLFALIDENKKIHGYIWAEVNVLDSSLFVNTFSVAKEYWGKGLAIPSVIKFLSFLKDKTNASRIFWITTNEKFFLKHGFKRSKNVLMEYNLS